MSSSDKTQRDGDASGRHPVLVLRNDASRCRVPDFRHSAGHSEGSPDRLTARLFVAHKVDVGAVCLTVDEVQFGVVAQAVVAEVGPDFEVFEHVLGRSSPNDAAFAVRVLEDGLAVTRPPETIGDDANLRVATRVVGQPI